MSIREVQDTPVIRMHPFQRPFVNIVTVHILPHSPVSTTLFELLSNPLRDSCADFDSVHSTIDS